MAADDCEARHPDTQRSLLVDHMRMLRSHPRMRNARLVVIPESNLAFEAVHLDSELRRNFDDDEYVCLREDRFQSGVRMNNLLKRGMAESLNRELRLGALHFWSDFMSAEAQRETRDNFRNLHAESMRDDVMMELRDFMRIVRPAKDPTRDPVVQYSGKLYGGSDDKVMALLLANTGMKIFYNSETYDRYRS